MIESKRGIAGALAVFMVAVGVLLLFLAAEVLAQAPTLSPDQRRAAEVAKGEAPLSLLGPSAYVGVLCTMQARLASSAYPDSLAGVLTAYYARPQALTEQEEAIAARIFVFGSKCVGGPYLFAFSNQDVEHMNFVDGDWVTAPRVLQSGMELGIHFYRAWPATKGGG